MTSLTLLMQTPEKFFYQLGHEVAGPLLCGMIDWLGRRVRSEGEEHILFLARDGHILQKIWQIRAPGDLRLIPHTYLLASRRALGFARIQQWDAAARKLVKFEEGEPLGSYLERLPVSVDLPDLETQLGRSLDAGMRMGGALFEEILPLLKPLILERAGRERAAYEAYLHRCGITGSKRLAVVDAGWYGSLQHALAALPSLREAHLCGYYLGVFPEPPYLDRSAMSLHGWLIDGEAGERFRELRAMVLILDFFCSADLPGFAHMRLNEAGEPEPVFVPHAPGDYQRTAIRELQRGILECAKAAPENPADRCPEPLYAKLRAVGFTPDAEAVAHLGRLEGVRGIDVSSNAKFAQRASSLRYLCNWSAFYSDYKAALWRPGFWAQLNAVERFILKRISPIGTQDLPKRSAFGRPKP